MKYDRRKNALLRLEKQLENGNKPLESARLYERVMQPLTPKDIKRIKNEMNILHDRLDGKKKKRVSKKQTSTVTVSDERWLIDIYSIHYGYVKRTDRKKNKGKSRKKMKKQKSVSFVKTVVAQAGMINNYREGKMGISPRFHKFVLRKDETYYS